MSEATWTGRASRCELGPVGWVAALLSEARSSARTVHVAFIDLSKIHGGFNRYWAQPPKIVWWVPNDGEVWTI